MKNLPTAALLCAASTVTASFAQADCGFCAERVTLSRTLAECYLNKLNDELLAASQDNSAVHLIDLSACNLQRSATALPDVQTEGQASVPIDEAFLIPEAALNCLAQAVETAQFENDKPLTFEVRVDCAN